MIDLNAELLRRVVGFVVLALLCALAAAFAADADEQERRDRAESELTGPEAEETK